jgi:hypothetical protein
MASKAYEKLKEMLKEKGKVSHEEIKKVEEEHGEMSDQERLEISAEALKTETRTEVTMDQYLEATKTLDTAEEGSEEYKKAEEIVKAFEGGG